MELKEFINKKDNPEIIKSYALELMDKYKDNFKIFTDGSKTETGQVGSAYYIPEIKMEKLRITIYRLFKQCRSYPVSNIKL